MWFTLERAHALLPKAHLGFCQLVSWPVESCFSLCVLKSHLQTPPFACAPCLCVGWGSRRSGGEVGRRDQEAPPRAGALSCLRSEEAAGMSPQSLPVLIHFSLRNTCQTWQEGHMYREHSCLGSDLPVEPRVPSEITFSPQLQRFAVCSSDPLSLCSPFSFLSKWTILAVFLQGMCHRVSKGYKS